MHGPDHHPPAAIPRFRVRVSGAVQGVGFRPFVYKLAQRFDLSGFVRNDAQGVVLEIEGAQAEGLLVALRAEAPSLGRIAAVEVESIAPTGERGFAIAASLDVPTRTRIVPDAATCEACLDDLFDAGSRFHLYPFVTCTHCGPRFTVSRRLPYDRARTSMAQFAMCPDCARDYRDPMTRRFHAETIACPVCGPRLSHSPDEIVAALRAGQIVALKGIGGFHLMCDARDTTAVARLRTRKRRDAKPFAIMVANEASAALVAELDEAARHLLRHRSRPVVLMPMRRGLAPGLAPCLRRVGVMLPYAPVHHLLFHAAAGAPDGRTWRDAPLDFAVVATSANPGGEPLVCENDDARTRLSGIADLIVAHDRDIVMRADDSVAAIIDGAPAFLRRARGFVPEPVELAGDGPDVVALGAHLKTTVTVTRGREAFVSQHIGDITDPATARYYDEVVRHLVAILAVEPEAVACDLHPDFYSSRFAEQAGLPVVRVQHHAAHVAAIAAEHRCDDVLGVALDGHGVGPDGEAWGGELMRLDGHHWRRLGHLAPLAMPGGEKAAREPWRMGLAALKKLGRLDHASRFFPDIPAAAAVARLLDGSVMETTSLGRLFDAAAGLLGTRRVQDYEGQAAMELEALVEVPRALAGGFAIQDGILDFTPLLAELATDAITPGEGAELFHGTVIAGISAWIAQAAASFATTQVALGGGCLMNRVLAEGVAQELRRRGLVPLLAQVMPANDGGLSLGQAHLARRALADGVLSKVGEN
jgi:hydrogenase maturation protein HypF